MGIVCRTQFAPALAQALCLGSEKSLANLEMGLIRLGGWTTSDVAICNACVCVQSPRFNPENVIIRDREKEGAGKERKKEK